MISLETTLSPAWTLLCGQEVKKRIKLTHFIITVIFLQALIYVCFRSFAKARKVQNGFMLRCSACQLNGSNFAWYNQLYLSAIIS